MGNKKRSVESWGLNVVGTDGMAIPAGTTAQRTASPHGKEIRVNVSLNRLEFFNGIWHPVALELKLGAEKTSSFAASLNTIYAVRVGSSNITVTLPTNAAIGDKIAIYDPNNNWTKTSRYVVVGATANIEDGTTERMLISGDYVTYEWTGVGKWRKTRGVLAEYTVAQLALKADKTTVAAIRYTPDTSNKACPANNTIVVHTFPGGKKSFSANIVVDADDNSASDSVRLTGLVTSTNVEIVQGDRVTGGSIVVNYDAVRTSSGGVQITVNSNKAAKANIWVGYAIGK